MRKRVKSSEIPKIRDKLVKKQDNKCMICERDLTKLIVVLDHCHDTGYIRSALCNNCNGLEGKLSGILRRIDIGKIGSKKLLDNIAKNNSNKNLKKKWIHPNAETHKEYTLRKNKRARALYKLRKNKRGKND